MSRSAGFGKRDARRCPWRAWSLLALLLLTWGLPLRAEPLKVAFLLDIDGPIGPAASDYLHRGMERALEQDAGLIILRIDTPGGLDTSMREIIQDILASPVAVVSYVAPSGARAASAGTYIVLASHVAAMAPGTNLGAATPIQVGGPTPPFPMPGRDEPGPQTGAGQEEGEEPGEPPMAPGPSPTLADKMVNDAVAYIRSLAQMRGRNADWAERAVREAASLSAAEALEEGVVDLVASNLDDLLAQIDGRPVTILGERRHLETTTVEVIAVEPDWRTRLLAIITNPNVAYILMLIGIYGIILEFYSPGLIVPGVTGAISLLLALYAFHVLPINYAGLALLLLGLALMVSEAFVPSFGALGLGGAVAFVIGSVMLLETDVPGYGISWMLILVRARRRAVVAGPEEMIGSKGRVVEWSGHDGRVRVHGELWRARSARPLKPGRTVRVANIENLTLVVESDGKKG
jgi:membrane-bound serine protease (ClpP class)